MRQSKWTKELCLEIAKNCFNRNDLQRKACYVYKVMYKNGWLEEVFPSRFMRAETYSLLDLSVAAKKYQTRNSFKWGDWNFYHVARRRGLLGEICSHMSISKATDGDTVYLLKTYTPTLGEVYKIGITSKRCFVSRLATLNSKSGLRFEVVFWLHTPLAKVLETTVLKMGVLPKDTPKFGGYKEMRIFTEHELKIVKDLLTQAGGV